MIIVSSLDPAHACCFTCLQREFADVACKWPWGRSTVSIMIHTQSCHVAVQDASLRGCERLLPVQHPEGQHLEGVRPLLMGTDMLEDSEDPCVVPGWTRREPKGNGGIAGTPGQCQVKELMCAFVLRDGLFGKVSGWKIQVE